MTTTLDKIRWEKELARHGYERNRMSPELANALRNEIRTALEADGGPFDINVARRVYDLAIAARDMCVAATGSVKEAVAQIKDTDGPMESLDSSDTPESQVQVSESFGARLLRELMATLPMLQGPRGEDPKQLVHALAEARRNGMHDVAEQIDARQFNRRFPATFPRFIQYAIWRYCSQQGLDICNGNRIDDRKSCDNVYCQIYRICDRISPKI
jgi:hypothetical protein